MTVTLTILSNLSLTAAQIQLPKELAVCPICKAEVVLHSIDQLEQLRRGMWIASEVAIGCVTEPDIESEEWEDWMAAHYSMPYVDWLPLEVAILRWVRRRYRFQELVLQQSPGPV